MREFMTGVLLTIGTFGVNAQNADEWLRQKETQIRYLIGQIAALKAYGEVIDKGYEIASGGLAAISNSREQDFQQQHDYFLSLAKVKPAIKNYNKVVAIQKMKSQVEMQCQVINSSLTKFLDPKQREYISKLSANLTSEAKDLSGALDMLISDELLELKDDERIQGIDRIYLRMQDCYEFSQSCANEVKLLVLNRDKGTNEPDFLSRVYGLK